MTYRASLSCLVLAAFGLAGGASGQLAARVPAKAEAADVAAKATTTSGAAYKVCIEPYHRKGSSSAPMSHPIDREDNVADACGYGGQRP